MSSSFNEKLLDAIRPTEWRYTLLGQESTPEQRHRNSSRRRIALIATVVVPLWLLLTYLNQFRHTPSTLSQDVPIVHSAFLHLLITATAGSAPFCRTLFSAGALNYPTPRIINWDQKFADPKLADGGYHLAKINGVIDFLSKLGGNHDHELVLIADGYDTWFQLRPEVLLQRYHAIIKRSKQAVWPRYGLQYDQSIVFSAQKECPTNKDEWGCLIAPPCELDADVYAHAADSEADGIATKWRTTPPRFLNSGMVIGPVGQMRTLYQYAKFKREHYNYTSDQEVLSTIFGEQEYYREITLTNSDGSAEEQDDPRNGLLVKGTPAHLECEKCQFGITLDYRNELSAPTSHSEQDYESRRYDGLNSAYLDPAIKHSTPPHWTPDYSGEIKLAPQSWTDTPLYTNKYTNISPAAMHISAGVNINTTDAWLQQWYHTDLRTLATAHAKSFRIPFAVIQLEKENQEQEDTSGVKKKSNNEYLQEYWGFNDGYGGARIHLNNSMPGKWQQWDQLCTTDDIGNLVFGDQRGKFQCPVHYLYWDVNTANHQLEVWEKMKEDEEQEEQRLQEI